RRVAADGLDLRDLADLHARDPNRLVLEDRRSVLEDGLQLERARERDVLGGAEEDGDPEHDQRDQADLVRAEPGLLRAPHGCPSDFRPWLPGVLPITVWPAA